MGEGFSANSAYTKNCQASIRFSSIDLEDHISVVMCGVVWCQPITTGQLVLSLLLLLLLMIKLSQQLSEDLCPAWPAEAHPFFSVYKLGLVVLSSAFAPSVKERITSALVNSKSCFNV